MSAEANKDRLQQAIALVDSQVSDPGRGLADEVFYFVSRVTPLINVDLLIKDENGRTLLTWRDDGRYPPSWHVPGGIIRYKERISTRIEAVAKQELGTVVTFNLTPLAVNEVIVPEKRNRAHFISMLFACVLLAPPAATLRYSGRKARPGQWCWHQGCPDNLISVHEMYRDFINFYDGERINK